MKKVFLLFAVLFYFTASAQTQTPPPPGCDVYFEYDADNDGFASFDLDAYFIAFRNRALTVATGFDLSGYLLEFYPSELDYNLGTNQITISPYTNIVSHQQSCFMKFIYSGTGPVYNEADLAYFFSCHVLETTNNLATNAPTKEIMQIYPNPVADLLNVKWNDENEFTASIYDSNGRILMSQTNAPIDVSKLQNGMYLVRVTSEGKQYTQKIMVAH